VQIHPQTQMRTHRYQSSLDLSQATYSALRHLPLSRDLAQHARQQLVSRLDDHCQKFPDLFHQVLLAATHRLLHTALDSTQGSC